MSCTKFKILVGLVWYLMFNATINNNSVISWWSGLLMEVEMFDLRSLKEY